MCLNCGCMRAHDDMADANDMSVEDTLAMIARTADKDRGDHPAEYAAESGG